MADPRFKDLIDRQALLSTLQWAAPSGDKLTPAQTQQAEQLRAFIAWVKVMPAVSLEVKAQGKWLPVGFGVPHAWDCSQCGAMVGRRHPYCPGCGAWMGKESENAYRQREEKLQAKWFREICEDVGEEEVKKLKKKAKKKPKKPKKKLNEKPKKRRREEDQPLGANFRGSPSKRP